MPSEWSSLSLSLVNHTRRASCQIGKGGHQTSVLLPRSLSSSAPLPVSLLPLPPLLFLFPLSSYFLPFIPVRPVYSTVSSSLILASSSSVSSIPLLLFTSLLSKPISRLLPFARPIASITCPGFTVVQSILSSRESSISSA